MFAWSIIQTHAALPIWACCLTFFPATIRFPTAALQPGLNYFGMLTATDLDVFWVIGANPLARYKMASPNAFIVVQDMFLTETARRANVVLPAASAYEKSRHCHQRYRRSAKTDSRRQDNGCPNPTSRSSPHRRDMRVDLGSPKPEVIFRRFAAWFAATMFPLRSSKPAAPQPRFRLKRRVEYTPRPEMVQSARNTLFTSGTLGRYSKMLSRGAGIARASFIIDPHKAPMVREGSVQLETVTRTQMTFFLVVTLIKMAIVFAIFMTTLAYSAMGGAQGAGAYSISYRALCAWGRTA